MIDDDYSQPSSYYGPTPHALFKLTHGPGQLTFVDRSVARLVPNDHTDKSTSSMRLGSLRRSWSTHQNRSNSSISSIHPFQHPSAAAAATEYEEHPHQFVCSIATRHITNYHFETCTPDEKKEWCTYMDQALESHVQRPDWWYPNASAAAAAAIHQQHHQPSLYSISINTSRSHIASSSSLIAATTTTTTTSDRWPPRLLHEKTQIPLNDMDVDQPTSSLELKPLPAIQQQQQPPIIDCHSSKSSLSSSSSDSSSGSSDNETGNMDMFTTAASSPVAGVFHYQRSNSSNNVVAAGQALEQGIMDAY